MASLVASPVASPVASSVASPVASSVASSVASPVASPSRRVMPINTSVHVANISPHTTQELLRKCFAPCGKIIRTHVGLDKYSRRPRFGFVDFNSPEEAQRAIEMRDGWELDGAQIVVELKRPH